MQQEAIDVAQEAMNKFRRGAKHFSPSELLSRRTASSEQLYCDKWIHEGTSALTQWLQGRLVRGRRYQAFSPSHCQDNTNIASLKRKEALSASALRRDHYLDTDSVRANGSYATGAPIAVGTLTIDRSAVMEVINHLHSLGAMAVILRHKAFSRCQDNTNIPAPWA
ncbi:hypothetical protein VTL71DRAFT_15574 [Oculimacula yallundae]|uniref:Uncharacterized protein n=1 Tax=Oculimacula yallundae TaxID=86028 RepID=A0ABR4CGZ5_9HELO